MDLGRTIATLGCLQSKDSYWSLASS